MPVDLEKAKALAAKNTASVASNAIRVDKAKREALKMAAQRAQGRGKAQELAKRYSTLKEQKEFNSAKGTAAPAAAPTKKYKGKYIGPDKYKGVIPKHLQHKYKGTYFGKEVNKGQSPAQKYAPLLNNVTKKKRPVPTYSGSSPFTLGKVSGNV